MKEVWSKKYGTDATSKEGVHIYLEKKLGDRYKRSYINKVYQKFAVYMGESVIDIDSYYIQDHWVDFTRFVKALK